MNALAKAGLLGLVILASACTHPYGPGPGPAAGYGPGTMGGYGPGMMGGYGPGMMGGQGMMWGLQRLDLSAEQRDKIAKIQDDLNRQHWALMQGMHAQGGPQRGLLDDKDERQSYEAMAAIHKQMFESSLEARRKMLEVLTPQQREQLGRGWGGRPGG